MGSIEDYQETEKFMQHLARFIDTKIKENIGQKGFTLLVFEFNKPGISNYISNASRECMIEALRESADRLEKKQDMPVTKNYTVQ